MSAVDDFLAELAAVLHVRGRARRRLLSECGDHLVESSAVHGPEEAVRRFGTAADLARGFELEIATRRALRATLLSAAGVLAVAASTLALIHAADPGASAAIAWAVVFFGAAQVSAVALALALLRAAVMRGETGTPADVALLCRRNGAALGFALLTMFAAGAAVPGRGAAWQILAGPGVALVAGTSIARVWWLIRRLDPQPVRVVRPPLVDVAALVSPFVDVRETAGRLRSGAVLAGTVVVAMAAASAWDLLDQGTVATSAVAAAIEAGLTVAGFALLGRVLGLYAALGRRRGDGTLRVR